MYRILFLFLGLFLAFYSEAQNFTNRSTGFEANYVDYEASCLISIGATNGGHAYVGGNVESVDSGSPLTIQSRSVITPGEAPAYWDLYFTHMQEGVGLMCTSMKNTLADQSGDSNYYHINMTQHPSIVVYARASKPVVVDFSLAHSKGWQYPNSSFAAGIQKPIQLTTQFKAYEINFSDWHGIDTVNLFGLIIKDPNVTVYIEKIQFGSASNKSFNYLTGKLFNDESNDCLFQPGEKGIRNVLVKATKDQQNYWGYTDSEGIYTIAVDSGSASYLVTPSLADDISSKLYSNTCIPSNILSTDSSKKTFCCADFPLAVKSCALLSVEINSDRRRRCFRNNTVVSYVNNGTVAASSPIVKVVYPKYVIPISSDPAWSSQVGDTLIYELAALDPEGRGTIHLIDSVVCWNESIRDLTQCTKAFISPKSQCAEVHPAWDGSSVTVFPYCESGVARFVVQNMGEDMTVSSPYRVFSNDTLIFQSTFQLISGKSFHVRYPANGAVIRLEADQHPSHPGRSRPRAFVEDCGTVAVQTSLAAESSVLTVPQDDLDEEVAISCMPIIDSYDPNDKAAAPIGITDDHLIKAGEQIKYTIRFQNTGSDVAYTVKVVDTLDTNLNMAAFKEGSASHAYVLKISTDAGGRSILTYTFNNINLKDSTTSEPESHGFFSFYVNIKEDLADGNTIHNKADIFFDYNSAIITNVVDHTIGTYVPEDFTKGNNVVTGLFDDHSLHVVQGVTLYPNPASDMIHVKLDQPFNSGQLTILDLSGHEVWSGLLKGEITSVSLSALSSGMYMYKVMSNGEYVGVGKLLVK